ncbi:hypothetical protein N7461_007645 [Penicillium sp. DV-2018c]|nr:hypothetical protein N7461_007645 [Penicillium sp. DV-2018c]
MEAYIRAYTNYDQNDWVRLLPLAELAVNGRTNSSTGRTLANQRRASPIQAGQLIARTIKEGLDWATASLAWAQQEMEHQSNRHRDPAPQYNVGDHVWLKLKNIKTDRPSKKLDWKNAKYEILELVGSHAVRLNTPPGLHTVFHVDLLRLAGNDPLPSQTTDDAQPSAVMVDEEEESTTGKIVGRTPHETRPGLSTVLRSEVDWLGTDDEGTSESTARY